MEKCGGRYCTLWREMQYHHSTQEFEIILTESSCKITEKCFSYIIKELLNWYWWILAFVGFNMHSQARACILTANSCQYSTISVQKPYIILFFVPYYSLSGIKSVILIVMTKICLNMKKHRFCHVNKCVIIANGADLDDIKHEGKKITVDEGFCLISW